MAVLTTYTSGTHYLTIPTGVTTMQYLCIGGGGGGGYGISGYFGGGGGAGGFLEGTVNLPTAGQYKCIVGGGGNANFHNALYQGGNSSISGSSLQIISLGGGYGGGNYSGVAYPASSGGSGGGGGGFAGATNGAAGKSGQGYAGGNKGTNNGGGGGAGGVGQGGSNGTGGVGKVSTISGTSITFGVGGYGDGGFTPRTNRGDGGYGGLNGSNGAGTAGIIIIKYSTLPMITTRPISGITENSAISGGMFSGGTSTQKGICWNTSSGPTTGNTHTNNGSGIQSFTATLTGLSQNHTYYVRAYAYNASEGIVYGNEVSFNLPITAPLLTGGTKTNFPLLGWSGKTQVSTWTGCTLQKWYSKASGSTYSLVASLGKATGNTYSLLTLKPNINYLFYTVFSGATGVSAASNIITIKNIVSAPTATYSSILMI